MFKPSLAFAFFAAYANLALPGSARADDSSAPEARRGFQMALRGGASVPMGTLSNGVTPKGGLDATKGLSDYSSTLPTFTLDIGGKIGDYFFVGGYLGFMTGGVAGYLQNECQSLNYSCGVSSFRIGAEVQYNFLPAETIDPWIGYGIGWYGFNLSESANGQSLTTNLNGPEYAHFMTGVDFRLNRYMGIGPTLDYSIGSFTSVSQTNASGLNINSAIHSWFMIGGRIVLFP
jgi:hypothetical protein